MTSPELERLVAIHQLKREPWLRQEFDGLVRSAETRLADAANEDLAAESRFDLAYGAAHAAALAGLRWHGYRSSSRYLVFQALPHTLGLGPPVWRVLARCHDRRNLAEYEGSYDVDDRLLAGLIEAAATVLQAVRALPEPGSSDV